MEKGIIKRIKQVCFSLLTTFMVITTIFSNALTVNATDNTFNADFVGMTINVSNAPKTTYGGATDTFEVQVIIKPELAGFAGVADDDTMSFSITLPAGATINTTFGNIYLYEYAPGDWSTIEFNPSGNVLNMTFHNVGHLKNYVALMNEGYNFTFEAQGAFSDFVTPAGASATVVARYGSTVKDSQTIYADTPALLWGSSRGNASVTAANVTSSPSVLNVTDTNQWVTVTPNIEAVVTTNSRVSNSSDLKSPASTITIEQTLTVPAGILVTAADLNVPSIAGVTPVITSNRDSNAGFFDKNIGTPAAWETTNVTYTVIWTDVPVANQTDTIQSKIGINQYQYRSSSSAGWGPTINITTAAKNVTFTSGGKQTVYDAGKVNSQETNLTNNSLVVGMPNPYNSNENYNDSLKLATSVTTDPSPSGDGKSVQIGSEHVEYVVPALLDGSFTIANIIDASDKLHYSTSGFGNSQSNANLDNFRVIQTFSNPNLSDPQESNVVDGYQKIVLDEIFVAPVQIGGVVQSSKTVNVTIEYADGSTQVFSNIAPGSAGTTINLKTASLNQARYITSTGSNCVGTLTCTNVNVINGNIKSVTYDYGTVNPGFGLVVGTANKVTASTIPHFYNAADGIYVWEDLFLEVKTKLSTQHSTPDYGYDWKGIVDFETTRNAFYELYVNTPDGIINRQRFYRSYAQVSFTDPQSTPLSHSVNKGNPINGGSIMYVDVTPRVSSNKDIYNVSKNTFNEMSYMGGDVVQFNIFVSSDDTVLSLPIRSLQIRDYMDPAFINMTTVTPASWAIYTAGDFDHENSSVTLADYTPVLNGTVGDAVVSGTTPDGAVEGILTMTSPWATSSSPNPELSSRQEARWSFEGVIPAGYIFVISYTVTLKTQAELDALTASAKAYGIRNDFDIYGAFTTGGGGYGGVVKIAEGKVALWPEFFALHLSVHIDNADNAFSPILADKTIQPNETQYFVATATIKNYSALDETITPNISLVLPYGWGYTNAATNIANVYLEHSSDGGSTWTPGPAISSSDYTVLHNQDINGAHNPTITTTDVGYGSLTLTSHKINVKLNNPLIVNQNNHYRVVVEFTATSPSAAAIYSGKTGGYVAPTVSNHNYHERIFASVSIGHDDFTFNAANVYNRNGAGDDIFSMNPHANGITAVSNNGQAILNAYVANSKSFLLYRENREIAGRQRDIESDTEIYYKGLDDIAVYGFKDWDNDGNDSAARVVNDSATYSRLSHYAAVNYANIDYKLIVNLSDNLDTVLGNTTRTINLSNTGPTSYEYYAEITNNTGFDLPFSLDQLRFRLPAYVELANNSVAVTSIVVATSVETPQAAVSAVIVGDDTTLSTKEYGYELQIKPGSPIIIQDGITYRFTIQVTVNHTTFAALVNSVGGNGQDYSVSSLNNNKNLAAVAFIPVADYPANSNVAANITSSSPPVLHPGTTTAQWNANYRGTGYDGVNRHVFNRAGAVALANIINPSNTNLYYGTYSQVVKFTKNTIQPGMVKGVQKETATPGVFTNIGSTETLLAGTKVLWTMTVTNPQTSLTVADIEDWVLYDVIDADLAFAVSSLKIRIDGVDALDPGNELVLVNYNSSTRLLTITADTTNPASNLVAGKNIVISYETVIQVTPKDRLINNAYFVPGNTGISFQPADVTTGTYITAADLDTAVNVSVGKPGVLATNNVRIYGGFGIVTSKTVSNGLWTNPYSAVTSIVDLTKAVKLGTEFDYRLEVSNSNDTAQTVTADHFNNTVIVDTLPNIGDTIYTSASTLRGSNLPILFAESESDLSDFIEIHFVEADGTTSPLPSTDYILSFTTDDNVPNAAFAANYDTASNGYVVIDSTTDFTTLDTSVFRTVRFEHIGDLKQGESIVIVIHAKVPTPDELDSSINDQVSLNEAVAINTFGFRVTKNSMNSPIYTSQNVNLTAKTSKLEIAAFLEDTNIDGYDDENLAMDHDAERYIRVVDSNGVVVAAVNDLPADESYVIWWLDVDLVDDGFGTDIPQEFEIYTSSGIAVPNSKKYYWLTAEEDVVGMYNPLLPAQSFDNNGKATVNTLTWGQVDAATVYAAYYLTGPRVSGYVFHDANYNGIWDNSAFELPISGVNVTLYRAINDGIDPIDVGGYATTVTNANGYYMFDLLELESLGYPVTSDDLYDQYWAIKVELLNPYNRFSPKHLGGVNHFLRNDTVVPAIPPIFTAWDTTNYKGSTANEAGYVQFFTFSAEVLNVGMLRFITDSPTGPYTGVTNDSLMIWIALLAIATTSVGIIAYSGRRKNKLG